MMLTKSKTSINTSKKLFSATFKRKCETVLANGLLCYSTRISAYPSKEKRIIELLKKQRYLPKDISKLVCYGETISNTVKQPQTYHLTLQIFWETVLQKSRILQNVEDSIKNYIILGRSKLLSPEEVKFFARCSLLVTFCSLLVIYHSLLFARCSTRKSEKFWFSKSKQRVLHTDLYKKFNLWITWKIGYFKLETFKKLFWKIVSLKTSCSEKSVKYRSRRSQMFFEITVLKKFAIFTGKHLCWSLFLIKQQSWRLKGVFLWILRNV